MNVLTVNLKDVYPFLGKDGRDPVLTAYLPYNLKEMNRESRKRPSVIICPGGGYSMCSEREQEPVALNFLPMGFNVFVIKYSVYPHSFPTQLNEVAAVYDLINTHAEEWNCDIKKVGIIGFSAGAHLAAHYSNAYNFDEVKCNFPNAIRPAFTGLAYPVITTDKQWANEGSIKCYTGKMPGEADADKFDCSRLVSDDTPPTYIWHTAEDDCVPVKNSLMYASALAEHNIRFEMHIYPYGCHGLSTVDDETCTGHDIRMSRCHDWIRTFGEWAKELSGLNW